MKRDDVFDLLDNDHRLKVCEIGNCGMSMTSVYKNLSHDLNMNQGCALWVQRILTDENLAKRVGYRQGNLLTKLTEVTHLTSDSVKIC
jgi:hypothetical protein